MILEGLLIIIIVIVSFYISLYFAKTLLAPGYQVGKLGQVCLGERCFTVEIAKTQAQQDKGLMGVRELDKSKGMLFVFDKEGIYPFWMKNTLIPLDMVWIDSNNKVVFISENVQPCKTLLCPSVFPTAKAKYVLEVNSGICKEIGLRIGDELKIVGD